MKIVLYANRNTGMIVLSYLLTREFEVSVITEDEDMVEVAKLYGCPVVTLDTMGEYDLFICCHGRKIIPDKYIDGLMINIHPCLYKYKGHNPIKRYIANKDTEGTVESLYITSDVDGGETINSEFFITPVCKTYADFYNIAYPYYIKCIHNTLDYLLL